MRMDEHEILKDALEKQKSCKEDYAKVFKMIERILELAAISRKEGFLALEEAIIPTESSTKEITEEYYYYHLKGADRLLSSMVLQIVDGTEQEMAADIGRSRYYASMFEGREALSACAVLVGCPLIQQGVPLKLIEERLMAILPEEVEDAYIEHKIKRKNEEKKEQKGVFPESFFEQNAEKTGGSATVSVLDQVILSMDTQTVQRVLREVSNTDCAVVMKGLNGKSRRAVVDNLSSRLVEMVHEDMQRMGPVRMCDVEHAAAKILRIVETLEKNREIELNSADCDQWRIKEAIAFYEHRMLEHNRKRDYKIEQLKNRIRKMESEKVSII